MISPQAAFIDSDQTQHNILMDSQSTVSGVSNQHFSNFHLRCVMGLSLYCCCKAVCSKALY